MVFCEFGVCACTWAEPGFSTVLLLFVLPANDSGGLLHELLHVCIVLVVALKEWRVTHTSSICSSVDVMFMFARWPMWLKLIYKHLKFYSSPSCCQPPPYPRCRYADKCSECSCGCTVCTDTCGLLCSEPESFWVGYIDGCNTIISVNSHSPKKSGKEQDLKLENTNKSGA